MRFIITICCVVYLAFGIAAADPPADSITLPADGFAPGWNKSAPLQRFGNHDLYGYINGGAELFLEFGFTELQVQQYSKGETELDLEVYRMTSPASALGIYLSRRGDETPLEQIPARNTGGRYQISAVHGNCFFQVNNFQGDSAALPIMTLLAIGVVNEIPAGDSVTLLDYLPPENLRPGSERLIRGPYALQPIFTFGEGDILQLGGKIFGIVGHYADTAGNASTRIIIPYPTEKSASTAFQNLVNNLDSYLTVLEKSDNGFLFQDYQKKFGRAELNGQKLILDIKLQHKPELTAHPVTHPE